MRANAGQLNRIAEEVTRLEDLSDRLYDDGMAALYRGPAKQENHLRAGAFAVQHALV